jgi:hypothetical protein
VHTVLSLFRESLSRNNEYLVHESLAADHRIRHYGYLGSAARKTRLRIRALLGKIGEPDPILPEIKPFTCQCCGAVLTFLREIAPIRHLRAPP